MPTRAHGTGPGQSTVWAFRNQSVRLPSGGRGYLPVRTVMLVGPTLECQSQTLYSEYEYVKFRTAIVLRINIMIPLPGT